MSNHIVAKELSGPGAWIGKDISLGQATVNLGDSAQEELLAFVEHLRRHPLTTTLLSPDDYDLPLCRQISSEIRSLLNDGPRFCVVDRLPIEELSIEEARACYWVISSMVCRPVAQKLDSTMIYDVVNTGLKADPGSGVRPDKTNIDLTFHNDNAYNACMPDVVGLMCIKQARTGGLSRLMSFDTVHNALSQRAPDVLSRLYQPFWFDRQREHYPEEEPTFSAPIFVNANNRLKARLGLHQIRNAYVMRDEVLDEEGQNAINALEDIFSDPDLYVSFSMEPGQIQYVDNLAIGHSRTHFEDFEEPDRRRHLVRLWMRDSGDRSYPG